MRKHSPGLGQATLATWVTGIHSGLGVSVSPPATLRLREWQAGDVPQRSRDELIEMLREQMVLLHISADSYDRGVREEALRLATTLRVLLHDTENSQSLLLQLGVKDGLRFLSTGSLSIIGAPLTGMMAGPAALAVLAPMMMGGDQPPEHRALLHSVAPGPKQIFDTWWNDSVLAARGEQWTRRDLVLALANKEGGAHVDSKPSDKWVDLKKLGIGFEYTDAVRRLDLPCEPGDTQRASDRL